MHTDIKPANIFVANPNGSDKEIVFKVGDFGRCRRPSALREVVEPYDTTRHYRAPEVILQMKMGFPMDCWSAVCLWGPCAMGVRRSARGLAYRIDVGSLVPPFSFLFHSVQLKCSTHKLLNCTALTLHYTTLHYTSRRLHYATLHCATLQYTALHWAALQTPPPLPLKCRRLAPSKSCLSVGQHSVWERLRVKPVSAARAVDAMGNSSRECTPTNSVTSINWQVTQKTWHWTLAVPRGHQRNQTDRALPCDTIRAAGGGVF